MSRKRRNRYDPKRKVYRSMDEFVPFTPSCMGDYGVSVYCIDCFYGAKCLEIKNSAKKEDNYLADEKNYLPE